MKHIIKTDKLLIDIKESIHRKVNFTMDSFAGDLALATLHGSLRVTADANPYKTYRGLLITQPFLWLRYKHGKGWP